ncbi:hypothetical protein [Nocardia transvalensis]|uniref:hypothetical protein n=1 Tax=Nocardia transvalensis TaxID=37333 RepID=UPI0018947C87|nr:hypothetical protein [Nocardia transvalensis]MBF6333536.1 hypothetical protein [Nocardia transvalensis]
MTEHPVPAATATAMYRRLHDAGTVMRTSSAIRGAAEDLSRNPLSEARAAHLQDLLTDPGLIEARRALTRLVDETDSTAPATDADSRW